MSGFDIEKAIESLNEIGPVYMSYDWNYKKWILMLHEDCSPPGEEGTYYGDGPTWESDTLRGAVEKAMDSAERKEIKDE